MDKELDPRIPEQLPCQNITTDELYDYRAEIDVKRSELLNVSNYIAHKEQILSIVQHEQFVKEVLYPSASDSMDELQYKRTVQDTLTQLVKLAMEHMKELEPCLEERKQLIDIRKEISQVEETNMELFQTCTRDPQEPFENKTQLLSLLER
jgi:hypothetical protein